MLLCEFKFVTGILKKLLAEKFLQRFKELDFVYEQRFELKNPIHWSETNCLICELKLALGSSDGPGQKVQT